MINLTINNFASVVQRHASNFVSCQETVCYLSCSEPISNESNKAICYSTLRHRCARRSRRLMPPPGELEETSRPLIKLILPHWSRYLKQEAQLPQRDRATRYVSKFVLCFTRCGNYKGFKQQKWPSGAFKGIVNGAIRWDTYDLLLDFHLPPCLYLALFPRYCHLFSKA